MKRWSGIGLKISHHVFVEIKRGAMLPPDEGLVEIRHIELGLSTTAR
jgi:hypothetical protein